MGNRFSDKWCKFSWLCCWRKWDNSKNINGGLSWPPQQSGTQHRLNRVYFLEIDFGFAVGENGIILRTTDGGVPVELTSFSAIVSEKDIILNWTTATETNNHGFEIEKLFGERLGSNWICGRKRNDNRTKILFFQR